MIRSYFSRNPHLIIILLFIILTGLFFSRIFLSEGAFLPVGLDFPSFNFPQNMFGAASLQKGDIPLWNPFVSNGQPYAADPNIGFFYPPKLLISLFHFDYFIMEYLIILHYFLAGIFNYALARDLNVGRVGSIIAGVAFMFSGFLIGQMEHINIVISAAWCPLVFLFFRRAVLGHQYKNAVLAGLFMAISIFGGHPQISFLIGVWCGIWLVVHLLHTHGKGIIADIRYAAVFFVVALAIAAVQILPAVELIITSQRGQIDIFQSGAHSLPPIGWVLLFSPRFLGQSPDQALPFWTGYYANLNELYGYVGLTTLFWAVIGSYVRPGKDKQFLLLVIFMGMILASGRFFPFYETIYSIPGMRFMRAPSRFLFWINLALPLLAGFGVDAYRKVFDKDAKILWREAATLLGIAVIAAIVLRVAAPNLAIWQVPETHPEAQLIKQGRLLDLNMLLILTLGLFAVVLGFRFWPRKAMLFAGLALGLVCVDLFQAQSGRYIVLDDPRSGYQHPKITSYIQQEIGHLRIENTTAAGEGGWEWLGGLFHGIPMTSGLPWNPFNIVNHDEYRSLVGGEGQFFDFMGAKFMITAEGESLSEPWRKRPDSSLKVDIYENINVMPRAFMVYRSIVEPDIQQSLALISNDAFDPAQTVLLATGDRLDGEPGTAEVRFLSLNNNEVDLQVQTSQPGYLVLSDTYYPGWRAFVDGQEVKVLRANHAFRAVFLPTGAHEVQFKFRPLAVFVGLVITLCSMLLLSIGAIIKYFPIRKKVF